MSVMTSKTIDDQIIERRIRGSSARVIAQYLKFPSAQVQETAHAVAHVTAAPGK